MTGKPDIDEAAQLLSAGTGVADNGETPGEDGFGQEGETGEENGYEQSAGHEVGGEGNGC